MTTSPDNNTATRTLRGTVVSDAMDKTVVVAVERFTMHPRYKKRYRITKRYKAHDENNDFQVGDIVLLEETRPISKDKRWIARPFDEASDSGGDTENKETRS